MVEKIVVIIPIHKQFFSKAEEISLLQCQKILSKYDVFIVYPLGLDISKYVELYPSLKLQAVESNWLSSLEAYNKMKRALGFYQLFVNYDYMLTYELDAYIFSDNWNKANCFHYDYIGAPWFEGYIVSNSNSKIIGVGNSGFSMRNIKTCILILKEIKRVTKVWHLFTKMRLNKFIRFSLLFRLSNKIWNGKGSNYYFIPLTSDSHINEDVYWGDIVPKVFRFKVANILDSIKFSFEMHPSELYKINQGELPIGCHAWEKYEPEFWKSFIT